MDTRRIMTRFRPIEVIEAILVHTESNPIVMASSDADEVLVEASYTGYSPPWSTGACPLSLRWEVGGSGYGLSSTELSSSTRFDTRKLVRRTRRGFKNEIHT